MRGEFNDRQFSVLIDESRDISVIEQMAVMLRKSYILRLIISLPLAIECVAFASQQFEYFMPSIR
ncbi:hypothetical protein MtrunA17_Chr8g0384781 [Medicago truncatula]|uniref:Transmembrane protein, putative n=1 Tax=Medicago truncatula TaxID=3880 RepID=A0A072TU37_MEDTR|nr:transmembrane protein, putative [Medicago truncatula]RHN43161.1 hypothetical protein MtrunA17_Chr8g0384781 [Medicago truncatula]